MSRTKSYGILSALLILALSISFSSHAGWADSLKKQLDKWGGDDASSKAVSSVLSNDEVVAGLKQALEQGADYAVDYLGKEDGFLSNPQVKIPMPEKLEIVEKTLRKLGQDKYADEFVLTMNRAAEQAVPLTLDILKQAITGMSIEDARGILKGSDSAATEYLRKVGGDQMMQKIAPIVARATAKTGVTQQYKKLFDKMGFMSKVMDPNDYDIDKYITGKTVDGLFVMVAAEEKKIRENPVARTTDLLKKVFGD